MQKLTVTIGIPTYNEEKNITSLLLSLLKQQTEMFILEKIIVVSDGSTDTTEDCVTSLNNKKVQLLADGNRKGKPSRINEIFEKSTSDIIVIIDADIIIKSNNIIEALVSPFLSNNSIVLTSGKSTFLPPKNFVQRIITTGIIIWNDIKSTAKNAEMYLCEGQIRAFSKNLYKFMKFPDKSADDVFPYLYCKQKGYNFVFVPEAEIYYTLPSTFNDYILQHLRFLQSESIHAKNFDNEFIQKFYVIHIPHKSKIVIKHLILNPFWTMLYLLLLLLPKIAIRFSSVGKSSLWKIAGSTK